MRRKYSNPCLRRSFPVILLSVAFGSSCLSVSGPSSGWKKVPEIQKQIVAPDFPERFFAITDFGALGDGRTICTDAIRRAIDSCSAAGGGEVVVPKGQFLTGAIHLKSRINLRLDRGAVLAFVRDTGAFPLTHTRFEGTECMNFSPFIYAFGQTDVAVTGEGILDGQADSSLWWPWTGKDEYGWKEGQPNHRKDRESLFRMAEEGVPVEERVFGEGHFLRTNFIQFYRCKNVLVEGVTIQRSPMWAIHPVLSQNVIVRDVRVVSHGPNNDGCNPESCTNVLIEGCYFDTGDDCIAIKSGRNGDGRRLNTPCQNILIRNCTMKDGHGGVVIGSEISGSCRDVFVEDCTMDSPNLGWVLRIKTNSRRGGTIENIAMRNITVGNVSEAVLGVYFNYEEGDAGQHTPVVRNISINHLTSQKSTYALYLEGYERSPISTIKLENCDFRGVQEDNRLRHVDQLEMKNVFINGRRP